MYENLILDFWMRIHGQMHETQSSFAVVVFFFVDI